MASERRIEKISNLIREELAVLIMREIDFPEGVLVTVTRVDVSDDVQYATVFVSILGKDAAGAFTLLQENTGTIQYFMNRRLEMRPVPKIRFALDEAEFHREKIERSLAHLKKQKEL